MFSVFNYTIMLRFWNKYQILAKSRAKVISMHAARNLFALFYRCNNSAVIKCNNDQLRYTLTFLIFLFSVDVVILEIFESHDVNSDLESLPSDVILHALLF